MIKLKIWFILLLLSANAEAQTIFENPLSDSIIQKVIPILTAEAELNKDFSNNNSNNEFAYVIENIVKGSIDPYLFIKSKSKYSEIPEGVVYDKEASKYLTNQIKTPAAVFSFGIEASEYSKEIYFANKKPDLKFLEQLRTKTDHKKVAFLLNSSSNFFSEHNFEEITEYYSPDRAIKVQLNEASYYHFLNYPNISTGPLILLLLTNPNDPKEENNYKFDEELKNSGLTMIEYRNIKNILIQALMDSNDPNIFSSDAKRPSNKAEQKSFDEGQKSLNIRKLNAYIYKKYSEELNPIFKEFSLIPY